MQCRNTSTQYGLVMKCFHGLILILFIVQLGLAFVMDDLPKGYKDHAYTLHKSIGIVIFFVTILFVLWRLFNPKPKWPISMRKLERVLAWIVHFLLYLCFLILPLSGWIMATASGHAPVFFWLFKWPLWGVPVNKVIAENALNAHSIIAWTTCGIVAVHILAALKHHWIDKDYILIRMFTHES